ncbi:MAG: hypothetical protein IPO06_09765 [Leptospiraceae bacterium]|nr:hypothetical protein [Leptospiraceae bacterium]MBK9499627.1 hypothetical protein [Leptospiraceae bacterium]MBP9889168.1 hypothetical protein [Leptospiraceae bacterium]
MLTEKEKINFNELINNALNSFKNKQYTKAIKYAKQAIKLYPEEKISYEIIIHCYQALGQYRLVPKYETLMEDLSLPKGYWKDRAKSFKDIEIQLIENRNPKKLIQLANGYADRDKHKLALEYYLEAYKLDKKDSDLLIKIGKLYEGHFFESDKANRYFTEAFLLNPKEETLEEDIFAFFLKTCKYEKGIAFYIKAYRSYPQKVALLKRVAFLYLLDNNIKSALQYYKKILKEEQFFDSYTVSQINSFFWESKMYSESLDFYKSLSKQSPENSDLVFQLAYWSIYIREDAKALDYFLKYYNSQIKEELANPLEDKLPILYQAYCDLEFKFLPDGILMFQEIGKYIEDLEAKIYITSFIGKLYYKAEKYEECIKLIQSILFEKNISSIFRHESGHPIYTLRKAYSKLKKNQESIDLHKDYLKKTKKYFKSEIIISLGDIYFENEEYKKAFNYYQQALKLEYANADQKGLFDEESRSMDETAKSLISLVDNWYEKKGSYFSYATYFIKKGLKLKSEDERFIYYFEKINNYRKYRFNSYQTAFYAYENILEDAEDNTRKFVLAKLKNRFHKNKEAIDDLEKLKENPTLQNKSDVLKLLGEIYREIGNHAEATKYLKEYQELSGDDSYEDFFLLDEKHQESVYNREYEIFLNTSFAHGLNYNEQNSLKGIAYEETTGQSEEAVIYIIYLIDSLKKDIKDKRFKKSEIFSILTLITFLYQRLFLLGKNLNMNAKKWEAYLLKTSEKYPDRSYLLENKRIKKIIKDVKEAEKNWKQNFLELAKKYSNELFNFQRQQIEVHEQASRRMEEAEKKLKTRFPNFDNLDLGSKELLISAEYIYKTLDASPKESDYSSVVAHYGRAIENELEKKLGLEGMLGNKQIKLNALLKAFALQKKSLHSINQKEPEILNKLDKKDLERAIFSANYLANGSFETFDKEKIKKTDFYIKISNERNAASHSGEDSFFNRARAYKVIKDMTDFLREWTEVNFDEPKKSASSK